MILLRPLAVSVLAALMLAGCASTPHPVEVLETGQTGLPRARVFALVADRPNSEYVGRLRTSVAHEGKSTLESAYIALRKRSLELGANGYSLTDSQCTAVACTLTLNLYAVPDSVADGGDPAVVDAVYILGPIEASANPVQFAIDGESVTVAPLHILRLDRREDGPITLSAGGRLLGSSVTLDQAAGRPVSFVAVHPGRVGAGPGPGRGLGIGVSVTAGSMNPVIPEFGRFLVAVLGSEAP